MHAKILSSLQYTVLHVVLYVQAACVPCEQTAETAAESLIVWKPLNDATYE